MALAASGSGAAITESATAGRSISDVGSARLRYAALESGLARLRALGLVRVEGEIETVVLFDARLVATLERAFAVHAGADAVIDALELQRAVGLRSEYLARRVLAAFDRDRDGVIRADEFLDGVRRLVFGTNQEKLRFAFDVHDANQDGYLVFEEVHRMIAISLADSDIAERSSQPPWVLAKVFFDRADRDRDGRVSFAEFESVLSERPELIARMAHSEALWIAPDDAILPTHGSKRLDRRHRAIRFFENRLTSLTIVSAFVVTNLAVAVSVLALSAEGTDGSILVTRALGWCLGFDLAVVLMPAMRHVLTWVRSSWLGRYLPIDEAMDFHRLVGHVIMFASSAHAISAGCAYVTGHGAAASSTFALLANLAFGTVRGVTGSAAFLLMATLWACALAPIRRSSRFELFYFTHLLYVPFLVLVAIHAPTVLLVLGLPLAVYVLEQAIRLRRRGVPMLVSEALPLRSGVTRLRIEPPREFTYSPGDYVFLRVPAVARHEWHPFTLSNAPGRSVLEVHVRSLGNWTEALRRLAVDRSERGDTTRLEVFVDGPYGTPSAHIFEATHAVFIGAGIGVTPFAAVLDDLLARAESGRATHLKKVHFFWLNRDQTSFEWFVSLIHELEKRDTRGLVEFHLCMTQGRSGVTALALETARSLLHSAGRTDLVTGLRSHTHLGVPDWDALLGQIALQTRAPRIDVFFCGPAGLSAKLRPICEGLGMHFREERF